MRYEDHSSLFSLKAIEFKERLFRKLTSKSAGLFLKGGDLISVSPQTSGLWEPDITRFIDSCAVDGYNGFLIDIGANIGLTSCQNGRAFKQVHMFEPNPLCVHVLEVNAAISLKQGSYFIHPLGLGTRDEELSLWVPKKNWGGAFIKSDSNSYSDEVLSRKDGFDSFDLSNYNEVTIDVRNAERVLQKLFLELGSLDMTTGVIKVDVEGYESAVIGGIAKSIPEDFSVVLIFENLAEDLELESVLQLFHNRGSGYVLERQPPWKSSWPRCLIAMSLLWNSKFATKLVRPENAYSIVGNIVIKIDQSQLTHADPHIDDNSSSDSSSQLSE